MVSGMGLDIYLYTRTDKNADDLHYKAWEDVYNEFYDDGGNLKPGKTKDDYEAAQELIPASSHNVTVSSKKYPGHLFNRRYLRSSYNGSGFNHAVPEMLGREEGDLYWIFQPVIEDDPEPYETVLTDDHISKLELVKERALAVATELRDKDPLRVMTTMSMFGNAEHMWHKPPTADEALNWYRQEKTKQHFFNSYSNAKGQIFGFDNGFEILAVTPAVNANVHIIYRLEDETKQTYIQSAEIVAEFCDEAIDLIKKDGSCVMTWSG
jgi:hypothetical protein